MKPRISAKKFTLILGLSTYVALAIMAAIFYKERTIFLDIAFHLFYILKDSDFAIQNQRFGAALTQMFPLISARLGLSLPVVVFNYSLGFIIYYFSIFLICLKVFKNWRAALAMLLFSTLMVAHTFYWIQSEFPQGIALAILLFAFICQDKPLENYNAVALSLLFLVGLTVVFFHPLMSVVLTFLALFHWLSQREQAIYRKQIFWSVMLFCYAVLYIKNKVLPSAQYDADAMKRTENLFLFFPNYLDLQSNRDFWQYLWQDYYLLPLVLVANSVYYIWRGSFLKLALMVAFCLGYLLLINVSYPEGGEPFYFENLYLPLSIFLIFPLVYDLLPNIANQKLWYAALILIVGIRIWHIAKTSEPYATRLAWEKALIEKTNKLPQKKLLIPQSDAPMDTLIMIWGTEHEFWLLSSIMNPDNVRSIMIDAEPERFGWALENKHIYITKGGNFEYEDLPKKYFNFTDTSRYQFYRLE